ncbi:NAD-dependent succinate-semialdehyde dehydrogenase [Allomuricauda sp. d1]|uniref:NAD-dependent succinate-semialdehyde dehydrogenase n=1 Tax=Allomuricauda sp. d1 TaxID=3136725 RepID=UPI0031D6D563
MKSIECKNPYNGEVMGTYTLHDEKEVSTALTKSEKVFCEWKKVPLEERIHYLNKLSALLQHNKMNYAKLVTLEMGKPITESIAEIEKCAWLCQFYEKNAQQFLADELIETNAHESFISYDPLGCILGIMPWNFPFWQVFRFAVPTMTAGNTVLLKHASNVSGCANTLERLFNDAGYPEFCFQTLFVDHNLVEKVISDDVVKAISLTGSEKAGKAIASIAGKHLKKTVLELGGNNACVVWEDADLEKYMDIMVKARMQNTGQSCIAAKRFIVVEAIYDDFMEIFKEKVRKLVSGNPMDEKTEIGVLAREDLAETLEDQVQSSLKKGAKLVFGNERKGTYYEPTIIEQVASGMPAFEEELFGPVAAVVKANDRADSLQKLADSRFGLGTMLFTEDIEEAKKMVGTIPDGSFFINEMVKSDPRLPFGGTKASGYGRELSREGIHEFVNKKTVYINK